MYVTLVTIVISRRSLLGWKLVQCVFCSVSVNAESNRDFRVSSPLSRSLYIIIMYDIIHCDMLRNRSSGGFYCKEIMMKGVRRCVSSNELRWYWDYERIANLCATCLDGDRARERFRFPVALAVPDVSVRDIRGRSPGMRVSRIGARTIARLEKRLVAKQKTTLVKLSK